MSYVYKIPLLKQQFNSYIFKGGLLSHSLAFREKDVAVEMGTSTNRNEGQIKQANSGVIGRITKYDDHEKRREGRRGVMQGSLALSAGLAAPHFFTKSAQAYLNEPTGSTVTLGFNVPQSGPYADEGADELRAYELAIEHLNGGGDGGMMNTFSSNALKGNGILGKKVEFVTGDTQTKSDAARASAKSMIEKDGAIMITGGSSSGVAVAVQALCQEAGVIFMAGLTHSNDTTGKDKKANGFRHFFNSYMSGAALAPVLKANYGADRKAYHLTADYNWGYTTEEAVRSSTEALGWETVQAVKTPLAQTDFSSYITPVLQSDADVLVLNHYGGNMVNSLTNAVQFGLRDRMVNGKQFEIVVPLYSRLMAKGAGANVKGIFGSTNWHWSLQDEGTKAFVKSFGTKYGFPPSQAAHTCYVQALLYADAVEPSRHLQPVWRCRSCRRLRVRRHGQRSDPLPRGRSPVLQGRARREG